MLCVFFFEEIVGAGAGAGAGGSSGQRCVMDVMSEGMCPLPPVSVTPTVSLIHSVNNTAVSVLLPLRLHRGHSWDSGRCRWERGRVSSSHHESNRPREAPPSVAIKRTATTS